MLTPQNVSPPNAMFVGLEGHRIMVISYNYHKPKREIVVINELNAIERGPHIVCMVYLHIFTCMTG